MKFNNTEPAAVELVGSLDPPGELPQEIILYASLFQTWHLRFVPCPRTLPTYALALFSSLLGHHAAESAGTRQVRAGQPDWRKWTLSTAVTVASLAEFNWYSVCKGAICYLQVQKRGLM